MMCFEQLLNLIKLVSYQHYLPWWLSVNGTAWAWVQVQVWLDNLYLVY